jgi:hypothetical protein
MTTDEKIPIFITNGSPREIVLNLVKSYERKEGRDITQMQSELEDFILKADPENNSNIKERALKILDYWAVVADIYLKCHNQGMADPFELACLEGRAAYGGSYDNPGIRDFFGQVTKYKGAGK